MKKRLLFHLLLLLFPVFTLPAFASAFSNEPVTPITTTLECVAPPPGWVITTDVQPDRVDLLWESPQVYTYFKVRTYDNTAGYYRPDQNTDDNFITIDSLEPNHCYTFTVYATYCPEAPEYGAGTSTDCCTPGIIIEAIVQVQNPCSLGNGEYTSPEQDFFVCAGLSTAEKDEPFNNAFIGQIVDGNDNIVDFAIAYAIEGEEKKAHVGETVNSQLYYFDYAPGDSTKADCYKIKQGGDELAFRIHSLNTTYVDVAYFNIEFFGNYTFSNCFTCQLPGGLRLLPTKGKADLPMAQISPNPFTQSTTFRYTLQESGPVDISLYDATGRLVKVVENTALQESGTYETMVDGAGLPDGVYFLHTMTGQNRQVFSLVKQE